MYGKAFAKMYQGSMVGSGSHVFAVWGYIIANTDPEDHTVELNPRLLSAVIGETEDRIKDAITYLNTPDHNSHCKEHDGRRIVAETGFRYFVVTHKDYREMKCNDELREYFRENKRKQREKEKCNGVSKNVLDIPKTSASASASGIQEGIVKGGSDADFWEDLSKLYTWVNLDQERAKMQAWLLTPKGRGRKITRGFAVNWLNKCDKPLADMTTPSTPRKLTMFELQKKRECIVKDIQSGTHPSEVILKLRQQLIAVDKEIKEFRT